MLGLNYICRPPTFVEDPSAMPGVNAEFLPKLFAEKKALSLSKNHETRPVISYDTVIIHQGRVLGKPAGQEDAQAMLADLSGKTHTVITGVSLAAKSRIIFSGTAKTKVAFVAIKRSLLEQYVLSGEPLDKAGSYAIQGAGALFVKEIKGCYYNVVGVPIQLTLRALKPYLK
jgi:septum formation protein